MITESNDVVLDLLDREFSLGSVLLWIEGNKVSILNTIVSSISFCYIGSESLATTWPANCNAFGCRTPQPKPEIRQMGLPGGRALSFMKPQINNLVIKGYVLLKGSAAGVIRAEVSITLLWRYVCKGNPTLTTRLSFHPICYPVFFGCATQGELKALRDSAMNG